MESFFRENVANTDHDEGVRRQLLLRLIRRIRSETRFVQAAIVENASAREAVPMGSQQGASLGGPAGPFYYKLVGMIGGRYFSLFDGFTEYRLGHEVRPRGKGVFVYETLGQAARNRPHLPKSAKLKGVPRVVMRLRALGLPRRTKSDKIAFDAVIPDAIIHPAPK